MSIFIIHSLFVHINDLFIHSLFIPGTKQKLHRAKNWWIKILLIQLMTFILKWAIIHSWFMHFLLIEWMWAGMITTIQELQKITHKLFPQLVYTWFYSYFFNTNAINMWFNYIKSPKPYRVKIEPLLINRTKSSVFNLARRISSWMTIVNKKWPNSKEIQNLLQRPPPSCFRINYVFHIEKFPARFQNT